MMRPEEILAQLSPEEKLLLLTGGAGMGTAEIPRLSLGRARMADGPHGVRTDLRDDAVSFPCLTAAAATFDKALVFRMGEALGDDCTAHGVDLILGPGVNMKRTPLCGRNFEYFSEDPVLTGELAAAYIRGVQSKGVSACIKHFAMNNQERHRLETSAEADERVMHEIYLKAFRIALEQGEPDSLMCSYNRIGGIPCAENKYLLTRVLREEWGYRGCVMSDWGAVRDIGRSVAAGLDLTMPRHGGVVEDMMRALEEGVVTQEEIDRAVLRVLRLVLKERSVPSSPMTREEKHRVAKEVAQDGIVLLKNRDHALPLTKRDTRIAVIGEYAEHPLLSGQGSAEVHTAPAYLEAPLSELRRALGAGVEVSYLPVFSRRSLPSEMIWPKMSEWIDFVKGADAVLVFAGSMESEDTEQFDRLSASLNPNMEFVIRAVARENPRVCVILQSGSALVLGDWQKEVAAILEMWLPGEGAGAVADVLTGKVSPSGKLPETFPCALRRDLEYPGDGLKVRYTEGHEVGYRYYDRHPEEILYPFGFGLTYSEFSFCDFALSSEEGRVTLSFTAANIGKTDAAEVIQVYAGKPQSGVSRPEKELIAFEKIALAAGETRRVTLAFPLTALAYYNPMLREWVTEPGVYRLSVGTSSRDILFSAELPLSTQVPYTVGVAATAMIG